MCLNTDQKIKRLKEDKEVFKVVFTPISRILSSLTSTPTDDIAYISSVYDFLYKKGLQPYMDIHKRKQGNTYHEGYHYFKSAVEARLDCLYQCEIVIKCTIPKGCYYTENIIQGVASRIIIGDQL